MVTLYFLGPIENYNFRWGSNLHSVDLSQKECTEANVRASTGQDINSTNPELESCKGTALAGFEPVTICFRDCFQNAPGAGGGFK